MSLIHITGSSALGTVTPMSIFCPEQWGHRLDQVREPQGWLRLRVLPCPFRHTRQAFGSLFVDSQPCARWCHHVLVRKRGDQWYQGVELSQRELSKHLAVQHLLFTVIAT